MDTLYILQSHDANNLMEILKYIFPAITLLIGLFAKHIYDKKQQRNKLKEVKEYLLFSIELLIEATKNQYSYIVYFNKQFQGDSHTFEPIRIEPSLQLQNFSTIPPQDIFKIFIFKKRAVRRVKPRHSIITILHLGL